MDRRFLAILVGIIIILGGIFVVTKNSGNEDSGSKSGNTSSKVTNHIDGQGQSNVTLQEYGDFQCPVCAVYYGPLKQVADKYSKDIYFQFSNLPLTSIHQNAFAAARAAEAAGLQNKYWEMHTKLYENQSSWANSPSPLSLFKAYATAIGLNATTFEKDYASEAVNDAINADLDAFAKTGRAQATPSFFINGKAIENSELSDSTGLPSVEKISAVLDKAIAEQEAKQQQ